MTSLFVLLNHPVAHHSIPSRENKSHPSARFSLSVSSFLCPFPPERLSAPLPPPPPHCLFQKVASDERRSPRRPQHDAKAARRAQLTRPSCSSTVQLAARTRRPLSFLFQFQVTGSPPSRSFLLLLPQTPVFVPRPAGRRRTQFAEDQQTRRGCALRSVVSRPPKRSWHGIEGTCKDRGLIWGAPDSPPSLLGAGSVAGMASV